MLGKIGDTNRPHNSASQNTQIQEAVHMGETAGEVKVISRLALDQPQTAKTSQATRLLPVTHRKSDKLPLATRIIGQTAAVVKNYVGSMDGVKAKKH